MFTLEAGQVLRIVRMISDSKLAEVETDGHRLLLSQEAMMNAGRMVMAA